MRVLGRTERQPRLALRASTGVRRATDRPSASQVRRDNDWRSNGAERSAATWPWDKACRLGCRPQHGQLCRARHAWPTAPRRFGRSSGARSSSRAAAGRNRLGGQFVWSHPEVVRTSRPHRRAQREPVSQALDDFTRILVLGNGSRGRSRNLQESSAYHCHRTRTSRMR
jgi:hypothetical protein